jgi:hypothetical protein
VTPDHILAAASGAIEEYLDELPPLPWSLSDSAADGDLEVASHAGDVVAILTDSRPGMSAAKWFVLSPTLLGMVGEFLGELAGDALEMPADMRAVAIAEVVLVALRGPEWVEAVG